MTHRPPLTHRPPRPRRLPPETPKYILLWKPYDVLCQFSPGATPTQRTLATHINIPGIYPVGRLDRDSEGLLLLTDDGLTQHKLCDPRFGHKRTYWAQVEGAPTDAAIQQLKTGVDIPGGHRTRPAEAAHLPPPDLPPRTPPIRQRAHIPDAWITLTLTEGRNRQVRHMTAAVGFPTLRLIRTSMHITGRGVDLTLTLADLTPGNWRHLTSAETNALRRWVHGERALSAQS
jgi:23S rRNA pseudouridine2457 synthase